MIGHISGSLTVVAETDKRNLNREKLWDCLCECGTHVLVSTGILRKFDKKSCGCKSKAEVSGAHGMYGTPVHTSWRTMIERCTKPYHKSYEHYKEIPIDPKWMTFVGFYEDMGDRPEGTTLDRKDGTRGYCKSNCRWADASTQQQNKCVKDRNSCGYPGISLTKGRYIAKIRYEGKRLYLGCFETAEEAHAVYDAKGRELFKEEWKSYWDNH